MDMVERLSMAIHVHLCKRDIMQYLANDEDCAGIAIAAIKAMREPSEGMVEACAGTEMIEKRLYAGAYRCMIDAALGEHK